jgi:transposase, IS5 family
MAIRELRQLSLADALAARPRRENATLERIQQLIDWSAIAAVLAGLRSSSQGAPGYPPVMMVKALLLQQWYQLSDPGLEEALADRLSFRRFVGLALDQASPDHTTIHRFRLALIEYDLCQAVFDAVLAQIDGKGLILRRGTLIDASLVEAAVKRPAKPKADAAPPAEAESQDEPGLSAAAPEPAPSKLVLSPHDPDASWAKKGHKRYFGYKGHVGVDQGSGIIRRAVLTTAVVADTSKGDDLILGDEKAVYADKAYDTKARRQALKARGAKDRIAHRPNKHHRLTSRQEQRNKAIGRRRSAVERVFAIAKRLMGWWRVRYRELKRNHGHFQLLCTAINLKRLVVIAP